MPNHLPATQDVLLRRRGLVFALHDYGVPLGEDYVKAVEIEWAQLGYVPSSRLRQQLMRLSLADLTALRQRVIDVLAKQLGAHYKHEPLFRKFPHDVPNDTEDLWLRKVLVHFLQETDQPCLYCRATGTTHVLKPCLHVVCESCWDGSNYSACPVCEHAVDRDSPFFRPSQTLIPSPKETVQLKLLDLGGELSAEARKMVSAFCERKQAMSKSDRDDFESILLDVGEPVLSWLPEKIPVKENVALVFGSLFMAMDPQQVLPVAMRHLKTATDVLRFIAVLSGADADLQPQTRYLKVERNVPNGRWWGAVAKLIGVEIPKTRQQIVYLPMQVRRFKMTRLSRPLRRTLLQLLESFDRDALVEDMLRHRSFWVWAGEFLHPHEYAKRYPNVARAFAVVRKYDPDGKKAPRFRGFYSKLELAARKQDTAAFLAALQKRPGELGRRLDHALRIAGKDQNAIAEIIETFKEAVPKLSNPILLTLYSYLPARTRRAETRVYWPKGPVTTGVQAPEEREPFKKHDIEPAVSAVTAELLRRFGEKPAFTESIVDAALRRIIVPFNERTASRAAVSLPRGSVVPVPRNKVLRMFLHWCQPKRGGQTTDIDLSVGFYSSRWAEVGVCSYYNLKLGDGHGGVIAQSGGDRRDAPFPDGASELIDVDWTAALSNGVRYAVMVVNNYSGMPFSELEHGFAGLMLREDREGLHFDPRTVELKFDLQGDNGIYMPLVMDLHNGVLHWLDVYSQGEFVFNNISKSKRAITRICPTLIEYFASGIRPTMYELSLMHAAARSKIVYIRDGELRRFKRGESESVVDFYARLLTGESSIGQFVPNSRTTFAALYHGDLDLDPDSSRYVLFPGRTSSTLAASDLIS